MPTPQLKSYLHFQFIVFLWGFTAVLGALITIEALPLVWYRMLLASFFVLLWVLWKKKKLRLSRKMLGVLFLAGAVIAMHWLAFFAAIKVSNVSITLALLSTGAFFTSIMEPIFYKRKVIIYELLFGLVVVAGLFLIFKVETEYLEGMILALVAAFLSAVFTLINGKIVHKEAPSVITFYELFFGVLVVTAYLFYLTFQGEGFSSGFFEIPKMDWVYILILALVCTAYAVVAAISVQKHLSPYTIMLTINLEPIYGILLALLVFGNEEKMSTGFYFGAAVILAVVILNGLLKSKLKIKRRVPKPPLK
jgi:drug/metabolite transporter (DMT)-like permease